jgi:hypothetical protein
MSRHLKRWIYSFLGFLCLFGTVRLYYRLTDDFRLANMTYELPFKPLWVVPTLSFDEHQHLEHILDQKFRYIGKGAQCYAFVSEDEQYVLKFFKFKHLKPNLFVEYLPPFPFLREYKQDCIERKKRKLIGVFNGYDLAFRENRETSQLIYLHLIPTQHLKLKAQVIDKIGLERIIPLDDVVFLLQRKGETLRTRLRHLLDQQQVQEAKQAMAAILEMYISEYKKGIYDHDHGILHNTGFIGQQPFHLDVGKLNQDERMQQVEFYKKDLEHVIWKMDVWMKSSYPHYYPEFSEFLAQHYQKWTGETLDLQAIDPKRFKKRRKFLGL